MREAQNFFVCETVYKKLSDIQASRKIKKEAAKREEKNLIIFLEGFFEKKSNRKN